MIGKIATFCKNIFDWLTSDRCFISYFVKAFPLSNNLLLITLALFVATFNTLYIGYSLQFGLNIFISAFVLALFSAAVGAGFCHVVASSIEKRIEDKTFKRYDIKTTMNLFYSGVGKRTLGFFGGFILLFIIMIVGMMTSLLIANKFICPLASLGLDLENLQLVMTNQQALYEFASQLSKSQIIKLLELFYFINVITPGVISFMLMLWVPEYMYTNKNILFSLFTSIKKIFTDFWNIICIYTLIVIGHIFIAFIFALMPQTSIFLYIGSLLFIYWLIFNIFTIFIYYRDKYVQGWIA